MQWVIHIGTQKTGSKALQRILSNGRLSDHVAYPDEGREGIWHEPLYDDLLNGDSSKIEASVAFWRRQAISFGVFSCEGFFDLPADAIARFSSALDSAKVVIFLRRQDAFANSFLNQLVKAHRVSLKDIQEFEDNLDHYMELLNYQAILAKWGQIFGFENVIPIRYDKKIDVVRAFCRAVGIPFDEGDDAAAGNPNPALDPFSYVIIRKLKEQVTKLEQLPLVMDRVHQRLGHRWVDTRNREPFDLLGAKTRKKIMEFYADSNEAIRLQWFPHQPSLFDDAEAFSLHTLDWSAGDDVVRELLSEERGTG